MRIAVCDVSFTSDCEIIAVHKTYDLHKYGNPVTKTNLQK